MPVTTHSQHLDWFSFTDVPKMQTLTLLKSHKRDDFCMPFPSRCIRKLAGSADDLVRLEEERRGHGEAEGLRSLEVDDQLELHGQLNGEVSRLGALQDLIDIVGRASPLTRDARPIRHKRP